MKQLMLIAALVVGIAAFQSAGDSLAQGRGPGMQGGTPQREMLTVMQQSHLRIMNQQMTGNTDRDFGQLMLAHSQATVEAARLELQYGKNAHMRQMATELIRSRERELQRTRQLLNAIPPN